jgi:hypothetical protein
MENIIIVGLGVVLFILILLNHISIVQTTTTTTTQANCSQTTFGCCPNGVDSKINYYGTNCPGYQPGPGYQVTPNVPPPTPYVPPPTPYVPPPPGPGPIPGGCAGTRYGCCPNNQTPKRNAVGSNC